MTSMRYTLTIETAKVYRVRGVDRRTWANAAIRTWPKGGSIDVQSDFGKYSHSWVDIGSEPFLKFLCEADFDYFMNKALNGKYQVFDFEATCRAIAASIIERRRHGELTREKARSLYDEADGFITYGCLSEGELYDLFSPTMYRLFDGDFPIERGDDPQARGFWDNVWPMFTSAWRRELELQQVAA